MSWIKRWKPKHVVIDPKDPQALGVCDYTGFTFNHIDLEKQMEWRGNNLVWTGLMVGKPYVDDPQPQNRPPPVKADPRPVRNPRIPEDYTDPEGNQVLPNNQLANKLNNFNWVIGKISLSKIVKSYSPKAEVVVIDLSVKHLHS